jgi:Na+/melibiose symporter-like transporter
MSVQLIFVNGPLYVSLPTLHFDLELMSPRHIYYLPFYFQAVKGTSAEGSGIRTIPYLGSVIISSIVAGAGITVCGYYKPFMIFGGAIFTVGAGMVYTLQVGSETGKWVGYQLLCGFGAGAGVQIPFIAVQVVLDNKDMPTGNAMASKLPYDAIPSLPYINQSYTY